MIEQRLISMSNPRNKFFGATDPLVSRPEKRKHGLRDYGPYATIPVSKLYIFIMTICITGE
jgi:hypothetical protein